MLRSEKITYHIVFQCFILVCFGIGISPPQFAISQTAADFQLQTVKTLTIFQPGDAVRIQVWQLYQEERRDFGLSGDYPINPDGSIIMPLIGQVRVKGFTVFEVMQALEERLRQYIMNPYVLVRPLIRVTLQGTFNRPGAYRIDPESSLWDLVALAGGPGANCDLKRMWLERGGEKVNEKLLHSYEQGYSLEEIGIESGDQIIAPGRRGFDFGFFVGLFNLLASIMLLYLRLRTGTF